MPGIEWSSRQKQVSNILSFYLILDMMLSTHIAISTQIPIRHWGATLA